ncbi:MAG: hypothetical protein MRY83_07380, partial [Flavobacteriales bacterium]|nr:hypothetical protein [Flavobacteriales bacterium]
QANELGIPLKTWHNESSPNQYEIASIHEKMNISIDHNLLLMDLLRLTARKYGLSANFHEKPFTGLSGSGKHCSWSILTPEGKNLISPGKTPRNSLRFSSLLLCAVKALKDNQELLSSLVSSHGNDQRLGKDDGPSLTNILFVGEFLSKFFLDVKAKMTNQKLTEKYKSELKNEFGKIPEILLNNKDSQRDAMIAFTGNKFEFRIIGASQNLSEFLIFWNVILSHEVLKFNDKIDDYMKNQNLKRDEAIFKTIELYIGYCEEVFKNNKGITQKDSSPLTLDKIEKLKETALNNQIFNSIEFDNWLNKKISNYYNSCLITYQTIHSFTQTTVIPGINEYLNKINDNLLKIKQIKSSHSKLLNQVEDFLKAQENVEIEIEKMANLKEKGNTTELILTITSKIQPQIEKCKHLLFNIDMCSTDEKWSIRNHNKILDIPSLQTNGMEFE